MRQRIIALLALATAAMALATCGRIEPPTEPTPIYFVRCSIDSLADFSADSTRAPR